MSEVNGLQLVDPCFYSWPAGFVSCATSKGAISELYRGGNYPKVFCNEAEIPDVVDCLTGADGWVRYNLSVKDAIAKSQRGDFSEPVAALRGNVRVEWVKQ